MIRWMREAQLDVDGSATFDVIAWAKEISEFTKKYEGATSVNFYINAFGNIGTVYWFADYEELATLDRIHAQILSDPAFFEILDRGKDFIKRGSVCDTVMRLF